MQDTDAFELEAELLCNGIPASVVLRQLDAYHGAQIEARRIKKTLHHSKCGEVVHFGFPTRFSAKKQKVLSAPPCIGEHNDFVLRTLLNLLDNEIQEYYEAGAVK